MDVSAPRWGLTPVSERASAPCGKDLCAGSYEHTDRVCTPLSQRLNDSVVSVLPLGKFTSSGKAPYWQQEPLWKRWAGTPPGICPNTHFSRSEHHCSESKKHPLQLHIETATVSTPVDQQISGVVPAKCTESALCMTTVVTEVCE